MFWKPTLSPQSHSYLKNSRLSDRSTAYEQSRVSTSFEFDSSFQEVKMSQPLPLRPRIPDRKRRASSSRDDPVGRYLTRVLMNRMLNVRLALKQMENLPTQLLQTGPGFTVAKAILLKTRLNVETSVLRTLLFAQAEGHTVVESRLRIDRGQNVFVLPTSVQAKGEAKGEREGRAIVQLAQLLRGKIRWAVKQFQLHCQSQAAVSRFFSKVCSNYEQKRQLCLLKMKLLPNRQAGVGRMKTAQLKLMGRMLSKKYNASMGIGFTHMKITSWNVNLKQEYIARQILAYAKIRKQQAVQQWLVKALQQKGQEERAVQVEEQKLQALRRIVLRNYLKLFKEIGRRVGNLRRAAIRIGCMSKINEQKSLWRFLLRAQAPS